MKAGKRLRGWAVLNHVLNALILLVFVGVKAFKKLARPHSSFPYPQFIDSLDIISIIYAKKGGKDHPGLFVKPAHWTLCTSSANV